MQFLSTHNTSCFALSAILLVERINLCKICMLSRSWFQKEPFAKLRWNRCLKIKLNSEVSFQSSCRSLVCYFNKKETPLLAFSWEFLTNIWEHLFHRTSLDDCFLKFHFRFNLTFRWITAGQWGTEIQLVYNCDSLRDLYHLCSLKNVKNSHEWVLSLQLY